MTEYSFFLLNYPFNSTNKMFRFYTFSVKSSPQTKGKNQCETREPVTLSITDERESGKGTRRELEHKKRWKHAQNNTSPSC